MPYLPTDLGLSPGVAIHQRAGLGQVPQLPNWPACFHFCPPAHFPKQSKDLNPLLKQDTKPGFCLRALAHAVPPL